MEKSSPFFKKIHEKHLKVMTVIDGSWKIILINEEKL